MRIFSVLQKFKLRKKLFHNVSKKHASKEQCYNNTNGCSPRRLQP